MSFPQVLHPAHVEPRTTAKSLPPPRPAPAPARSLLRRLAPLFVLGALLPHASLVVASVIGIEWFTGRSAEISAATLTKQAEDGLERYTRYEALQIDASLGAIEDDVDDSVREVREALERTPPARGRPSTKLPSYGYVSAESGVYGNFDHVGACSPLLARPTLSRLAGDPAATGKVAAQLDALCGMTASMREQVGRRARLVDLFWVVLDSGASVVQPPYDVPAMLAANPALADIDERAQPYFQLVAPAENPSRKTRWLQPYLDPFRRVWMTSCVAPVYSADPKAPEFLGATGMDILLSVITQDVLDLPVASGGSAFLLREDGTVVAMPSGVIDQLVARDDARRALHTLLRPAEEQAWDEASLAALGNARIGGAPSLDALGERLARGGSGHSRVRIGEEELLVSFAPVERAHWVLATLVPLREVLAPVRANRIASQEASDNVLLAAIVTGILSLLGCLLVAGALHARVVQPIMHLSRVVSRIRWDDLEIPRLPARDDEVGILYARFTEAIALGRESRKELGERHDELRRANERLTALNEELARARLAAEEASLVKGRFLVNMSHEIRTPMNAIIGMGHVMLAGPLAPEQQSRARKLVHAARGLLRVLNDVLDLSKLEANRLTLEQENFTLGSVLRDVEAMVSEPAKAKGLSLSLDIDPNVPPRLSGDAYRLTQILTNLMGNAVKFTERGAVSLTVRRLPSAGPGASLELTVQDTGIGIPAAALPKLFSPFVQADSSMTRRFGGTGLGLAICKELCETMGGSIEARSFPGRGATFRCVLPFAEVSEGPHSRAATASRETDGALSTTPSSGTDRASLAAPPDGERRSFTGAHVLLVDDNVINREVGKAMLEDLGVMVTTAEDGKEAVELLSRPDCPFGLVLMDVQMPGMDGLTATRLVRGLPDRRLAGIPILALTAHAMEGHRAVSLAAGMNDHLTKPLEPGDLEAALQRWFRVTLPAPPPRGADPETRS